MSDKKDVYGWKYYRKGKLIRQYPNDIPETMEDAVIELQENGVDVSDCVDDCWSPDYPPEDSEYQDTMVFKPMTDDELINYGKIMQQLKDNIPKVSDDFEDKLWAKMAEINALERDKIYPTRLQSIKDWFRKWYFSLFR